MHADDKVYVAGHSGMVGSAVLRNLASNGCTNVVTRPSDELDLTRGEAVDQFFAEQRPDVVINAAARVGGIHANSTYPAEFIHNNLAIALNVVQAGYRFGVKRMLFLGSSCIYPREAPQPMKEDYLLSGPLELTNEAYAIAKIAGLKLCQYYRKQYGVLFHSAMPTNLYGPGDNYHPDNSHVIPGLIRRFHDAKQTGAPSVAMWGTGTPRREFLYVDDVASAFWHLLQLDDPPDIVNVGCGEDLTIAELAEKVAATVGYEGQLTYDTSKPDGTMLKRLDVSRITATGWRPAFALDDGLRLAYKDFLHGYRSE